MSRAILYAGESQRVRASGADGAEGGDALPDKLVKYVPAEVLAFFVPTYANLPESAHSWAWAVFAVGLVGTVLYALATRLRDPGTIGPWYYYVLCAVAFVGWAVSATTVGTDLFGIDHAITPAILSTTVLLVPLIDELVTRLWVAKA